MDTKNIRKSIVAVAILLCCALYHQRLSAADITYWDRQRKGANNFNCDPSQDWWPAAKAAKIQIVRLTPSKWSSEGRDFLIGNADKYTGIPDKDFLMLKRELDRAQDSGLKVVLTMLSLPGNRWRQHNGNKSDFRLWKSSDYHQQAADFWHDLVTKLANHPAIAGYNPINEPHPERLPGEQELYNKDPAAWHAKTKGSAADLRVFYAQIISAIRKVDRKTPIILDCGMWAGLEAIEYMPIFDDDKIIYSFHIYQPWEYVSKKANQGRFSYPTDPASVTGNDEESTIKRQLNRQSLAATIAAAARWQKKHRIPDNRIFAAEFGCHRMVPGAAQYLADVLEIIEGYAWHWALYAFREDCWDGMDYELGTKPLGWDHWKAVEAGKEPPPLKRIDNPIWDVMKEGLAR